MSKINKATFKMAMKKIATDFNITTQKGNAKPDSDLSIDIVTDPNSLYLLREEWDALYDKADNAYFTQSFEWNWRCWQTVSEPKGDRLHCLIMRHKGQAALIWCLVIRKKHHFWSMAFPLALVSGEYSNVLVDETKDSCALMELALHTLIKNCPTDLIELPNIRVDSLLYQIAVSVNPIQLSTTVAPYVSWENHPNWDSYYQSLSKSMRHNLSRRYRRLAELGVLSFEMLGSNNTYQKELEWLIETKLDWAVTKNKKWSPAASSDVHFLSSIINYDGEHERMILCVLKLNDNPIAGQLMCINKKQVELVMNAYDSEYNPYSPAQIMTEYCIKWAFEQSLTVDFSLGDGVHKRDWTNGECEVVSYEICCNNFGNSFVLLKAIYRKLIHYYFFKVKYWFKSRNFLVIKN